MRPPKNAVDPRRPYAFLVEDELAPSGRLEPVATLFLTNRECPFRCAMCDLWKNTLDDRVPAGAILEQIDFALDRLPSAKHIKLYNSGNFFDRQAIPREDHAAIAERVGTYETVIIENHPRLCRRDAALRFRDHLAGTLEIALGLETAHPDVLRRLNKQMTVDDYVGAAQWLVDHEIAVRTFVLLRPPYLSESEGIEWAVRSVELAVDAGSRCVAVIPTRPGNGYLDHLLERGRFSPPRLSSLERVLEACVARRFPARIFADLWDLEQFSRCDRCFQQRRDRLAQMNRTQTVPPPVLCDCEA